MTWHALQLSQPNPNEFFRLTKGLMEFGAYDEVCFYLYFFSLLFLSAFPFRQCEGLKCPRRRR